MNLSDVINYVTCPECALSDLVLIIQKSVEQFNEKSTQVQIDVQVRAIEAATDVAEEAKLKA